MQPQMQPVYPYPPVYQPPQVDLQRKAAAKTFNRGSLLVLLMTAAAVVFEVPLMLLATFSGVDINRDEMAYQLLVTAMVPLSTALPFVLYLLFGHKDVRGYLRFEKVGFPFFLGLVLAGLGVCLLANYPAFLLQDFLGSFGYESASQSVTNHDSLPVFIVEILSTAVLVPVMEELAFRGVVFSSLRPFGTGFAVVGSAMIFALAHLDLSTVIFAFVAGLVFGYVYARTENLWVSICIHALNNGLAVFGEYAEFLFPNAGEETLQLLDQLQMDVPVAVGVVAVVFLLLFARKKLLGPWPRHSEDDGQPMDAGRSLGAYVRAPMFWVLVAAMAAFTASLFF